jgi:hypothetical protein
MSCQQCLVQQVQWHHVWLRKEQGLGAASFHGGDAFMNASEAVEPLLICRGAISADG